MLPWWPIWQRLWVLPRSHWPIASYLSSLVWSPQSILCCSLYYRSLWSRFFTAIWVSQSKSILHTWTATGRMVLSTGWKRLYANSVSLCTLYLLSRWWWVLLGFTKSNCLEPSSMIYLKKQISLKTFGFLKAKWVGWCPLRSWSIPNEEMALPNYQHWTELRDWPHISEVCQNFLNPYPLPISPSMPSRPITMAIHDTLAYQQGKSIRL